MGKEMIVAKATIHEFIKTKKSFSTAKLYDAIKKAGGIMKVSDDTNIDEYLEDFEKHGTIKWNCKTKKYDVKKIDVIEQNEFLVKTTLLDLLDDNYDVNLLLRTRKSSKDKRTDFCAFYLKNNDQTGLALDPVSTAHFLCSVINLYIMSAHNNKIIDGQELFDGVIKHLTEEFTNKKNFDDAKLMVIKK